MKNKINELSTFIGNTPIIKANNLMKKYNLKSNLYLKIESLNYSGSIKDRLAYYIIKDGIDKELITKDTVIIEATSGNTGISIAAISKYLGIKCIIVMPNSASIERIKILKSYDAEVILTPKEEGMTGSINKVLELKKIYKHTRSADEIFLQTILYNSKYKENLYYDKFDDNYIGCMRLIDWNRGNPYVWKSEDYNEIINSDCMFARKFDINKDKNIINKIAKHNLKNN